MDRVRLRPGRFAHIIDLSPDGALIETAWRLSPGTRIEVEIGHPAMHVSGRIVRSHVAVLSREHIRYRAAVAFEHKVPVREGKTPPGP
jgi:hypothetical protein